MARLVRQGVQGLGGNGGYERKKWEDEKMKWEWEERR
jgi:hypothetical protein